MNTNKDISRLTKCLCIIVSILSFFSCTENEKYLKIETELVSDKVNFVDVKSKKTLTYNKLVINNNEIDEIHIAGFEGVTISWFEGRPPLLPKKFQNVIDVNESESKMKYTLEDGILTIIVPFLNDNDKKEVIIKRGRLYKGNANFENVQQFEVSFFLSEDKSEIYDLTIAITGLQVTAPYGNIEIKQSIGNYKTTYSGTYPVQGNKIDVSLGQNGNMSVEFKSNNVFGTIAYKYIIRGQSGQNSYPDIPVDLGRKSISFR